MMHDLFVGSPLVSDLGRGFEVARVDLISGSDGETATR